MQSEMQHLELFVWHLSGVVESNRFDIIKYVACIIYCSPYIYIYIYWIFQVELCVYLFFGTLHVETTIAHKEMTTYELNKSVMIVKLVTILSTLLPKLVQ